MVESVFNSLIDIVPYTEKGGYLPSFDKNASAKTSKVPLSVISSLALRLFPWELMLDETVVRYITFQDMVQHFKQQKQIKETSDHTTTKYFSFVFSTGEKNLLTTEEERRKWIVRDLFYHLRLDSENHLPSALRHPTMLSLFHSPLVKFGKRVTVFKRKYKLINWFDLSYLETPSHLVELVAQNSLGTYPIVLMTYSDMLENSEALSYLMRALPNCTFIFIPNTKIKQVVAKLLKAQEDLLTKKKTTEQTVYQFVLSTLGGLQAEMSVPIAVFNPPRDVY
eukprot:TRINITY_DN11941_c0_g1_i1.p1 TRINITY_DN11941_c0_g1~~TRINITY_DN11941_c0_g1_i1.p1  ORF type:complete len:308 (-),score=57.52 TRINITY_DN11941_c0_g1_i1:65-904(-)